MKEQFTPGEWKIEERQARFGDMELYGFAIFTETKRICMCQTDDDRNIPQIKANASLIAAAPDLYNVLKDLIGNSRENWQEVNVSKETIDKALKALKKARGEE